MGISSRLRSAWRPVLVVLSLYLLIGASLWGLLAVSVGQLLATFVVLSVSVLIAVRLRGDEGGRAGAESVWNAIPSRQYNGRHAESGGLARGEQEQALQEIHDDAQRHDEHHRGK